jgi:outer membrane receptor protein involved in Fe transport
MASYFFRSILQTAVLFVLACYTSATAQTSIVLKGKVTDDKGEPLTGVNIGITSSMSAISDANGLYQINITAPGTYDLIVSYVGYETLKQSVQINSDTELDLSLKPSSNQLNQVVVSAGKYNQEIKRVTVSTDIIKPYLVENKVTINMEHIMNQLPGVNVVDGQANIRGGSGWTYGAGSRVLVMLDDMPYITGDASQVQWKFLPTENIEQMEVIKGASSVLYGSSALNGVINIRTAAPKAKPLTGITTFSGVYDKLNRDSSRWNKNPRFQYGANIFHSHRIKQLDLTLSANFVKDEGYRLGEKDERGRFSFQTNYHSKSIAGLKYGVNGSLMYTRAQSFLLWENWAYAYTALDSQTTDNFSTNISIDPHLDFFAFGLKHRVRSRFLRTMNDISTEDTSVNQDNSSWLVYGEYQLQKDLPRQLGVVTGGIMANHVEGDAALYNGKHTTDNIAPYLQVDLRIWRFSFSGGLRYEHFSMDGISESKTIGRAGISAEITRSTFVRTSFGQGYRFPSIAERYITTSAGALNVFPNPSLKSETGWNAEIGIRQGFKISSWQGFADVAYFHTEYQNMVEFNFGQWKPLDFSNPSQLLKSFGFMSVNVGNTRISGIDAALTGTGKVDQFTIKTLIGYTYMNPVALSPDEVFATDSSGGKYTYRNTSSDSVSNTLKYRYAHLAKGDIELSHDRFSKLSIGFSVRYNSYMKNTDRIFESFPISLAVPGVNRGRAINRDGDWVMDARVSFQVTPQFKINAVVNNITNHEQMTRPADMRPPRLFILQLSYRF